MSYWGWKTLHVIVAAILAAGFLGALWPLQKWLRGRNKTISCEALTVAFQRQLQWFLPLAVIQVILGMITLFSEPAHQTALVSGLLMFGIGLLAISWLIGLGLIKKGSDDFAFTTGRFRYFVILWLTVMGFILLGMLYLMVNFRSLY